MVNVVHRASKTTRACLEIFTNDRSFEKNARVQQRDRTEFVTKVDKVIANFWIERRANNVRLQYWRVVPFDQFVFQLHCSSGEMENE